MATFNSLKAAKGQLDINAASTVANLPSAPTLGMIRVVTDATSPDGDEVLAGGGAAKAIVWYNGTNWIVMAK
jgi:hypothetical protein